VALGEFLTESAQYYGRRLVVHANMERIDFKGLTACVESLGSRDGSNGRREPATGT
jgi:hypothetical protein